MREGNRVGLLAPEGGAFARDRVLAPLYGRAFWGKALEAEGAVALRELCLRLFAVGMAVVNAAVAGGSSETIAGVDKAQ